MIVQAKSMFRRARNFARSLVPRTRTFYILGQEIAQGTRPDVPAGVRLAWVEHQTDPHFEDMLWIAERQGMDREWCTKEIRRDNSMLLALVADGGQERVAGVGWLNGGFHYIDDIYHDLDTGPRGCQLFNALVLPEFRGRRLQRVLTRGRLERAIQRGKRWVYTVVSAANTPSLRNNFSEGNRPILRVDIVELRGRKLTFLRRLSHRIPMGRYLFDGWPQWCRWAHFVRPKPT